MERQKKLKCEIFRDSMQNYKKYAIPPAQLVIADVPHSDSAEYKMWGNGIALPCLLPMMKAMKEKLQEEM